MDFNWKNIVRGVAPALGNALGGPAGGVALKFIAEQLLGKPDASEEDIATAIQNATPEQIIKLKEIDSQFKLEMHRLVVDGLKIDMEDRQSARVRQAQTKDHTPTILAVIIISSFVAALFFIIRDGQVTEYDNGLLLILSNMATYVLAYYFGSSAGSRLKDQIKGKTE